MARAGVDELIEALAADARPVRPLGSPMKRAAITLGVLGLAGALALALFGDFGQLRGRYAGREEVLMLEMGAMLATAVLGITAAFFLSIPGRSKRWLLAPLPPLLAWLLLSGAGCYEDAVARGLSEWKIGHSADCLVFILVASAAVGAPLAWRLSRATPIDPLHVALLGGLGTAAGAAFLLQFFHPFEVTVVDFAIHLFSLALVVGAAALINRRLLSPA
jgi:hypothetical protein